MPKDYFARQELSCHCGCGKMPNPGFVVLLNRIREDFGQPIGVTNVSRCQFHNDNMTPPGAPHSAHVDGVAADLVRTPELLAFLLARLETYNVYLENPQETAVWIHVQTRPVINRVFSPAVRKTSKPSLA